MWKEEEESISDSDAYDRLADFKLTLHRASEELLSILREQREQPKDDLSKFTVAATLLRMVQRRYPDRTRIKSFTHRYSYLDKFISYSNSQYNCDKLRDYMASLLTKGDIEGIL